FHFEYDRFCHAMNGQFASAIEFVWPRGFDARALERDRRVIFDVQKVRALQVRVAVGLPCVYRRRIDHDIDGRLAGIVGIPGDRALDVAESAANIRNHHVADNTPLLCASLLRQPTEVRSWASPRLVDEFAGTPLMCIES